MSMLWDINNGYPFERTLTWALHGHPNRGYEITSHFHMLGLFCSYLIELLGLFQANS